MITPGLDRCHRCGADMTAKAWRAGESRGASRYGAVCWNCRSLSEAPTHALYAPQDDSHANSGLDDD